MILVSNCRVAAQELEKGLLQEIVGRRRVAGHPIDVSPHRLRRLSVEGFESCLVHRPFGWASCGCRRQAERQLERYCACGESHCLVIFHETAEEIRKPTPRPIMMNA